MEELSVEEKAKRFDEALEIAKYYYDKGKTPEFADYISSSIFPELKESEDERIKKDIKEILDKCLNIRPQLIEEPKYLKAIAWLENQGEQKETLCDKCRKEQHSHSCQDITELGRCAVEHEHKPADKVEPKFKVGDTIKDPTDSTFTFHINAIKDGKYMESDKDWVLIKEADSDYELVEQKPAEEYNITGISSKKAQGKLGKMIKNIKSVKNILKDK